jgi:ribosome-associated toxin RatA of RatAB toxin-antitoxin module
MIIMTKMMTVTAVLVLLVPGVGLADSWKQKLDQGEIMVFGRPVKGSDLPEVVVKAVINAPPARVWALVSRCANYDKFMPRIKASRELSRKGGRILCRVTVDMPFPYSDLTATTEVRHTVGKQRWYRRWKLIKGDYKVNRGSWVLTPFNGDNKRTYAVYRAQAVPNAYVPGAIRRMAQKSSLPKMIKALRAKTKR